MGVLLLLQHSSIASVCLTHCNLGEQRQPAQGLDNKQRPSYAPVAPTFGSLDPLQLGRGAVVRQPRPGPQGPTALLRGLPGNVPPAGAQLDPLLRLGGRGQQQQQPAHSSQPVLPNRGFTRPAKQAMPLEPLDYQDYDEYDGVCVCVLLQGCASACSLPDRQTCDCGSESKPAAARSANSSSSLSKQLLTFDTCLVTAVVCAHRMRPHTLCCCCCW